MNALKIQDLCKAYPGFYLDHLNLTLPTGCIMGLIGENGAGKSTTIKLILDMIHKDSGTITLLSKENCSSKLIKEELGVVLDEIGYPDCITVKQLNQIMKYTYRNWDEEMFFSYITRFNLPLKKAFKTFSKGMKMKLGIAVALSHNAKLLILDEATSGLDPVIRDEILDIFFEFTRDDSHSILISSHIVSDLEKLCDYIAFLHNGKLLLCEEKDYLLEHYGILRLTNEKLSDIPDAAIKAKKSSPYGTELLIDKTKLSSPLPLSPIGIEELFVYMVKEDTRS